MQIFLQMWIAKYLAFSFMIYRRVIWIKFTSPFAVDTSLRDGRAARFETRSKCSLMALEHRGTTYVSDCCIFRPTYLAFPMCFKTFGWTQRELGLNISCLKLDKKMTCFLAKVRLKRYLFTTKAFSDLVLWQCLVNRFLLKIWAISLIVSNHKDTTKAI